MLEWQVQHKNVICDFLNYLFSKSNKFILKGGTSLMLCYNLTRFSEDIDLDGFDKNMFLKIVANYVKERPFFTYRIAKDTDTVKRIMLHYDGIKPLKVEVSYRRKEVAQKDYTIVNVVPSGIIVYTIENIMIMKINAFNSRDKLRDLYDITFIYLNYKTFLNVFIINSLRDAIAYKGVEYFDYIIKTQFDDLINANELLTGFLTMYYELGLK